MKIKNNTKCIKETLLEALCEVIFSLVFFGIGALVISLFGIGCGSSYIDGDLVILIGIVAFFTVCGVVCAWARWVRKTINKNRD